jgi:hypothetical protein
MADDGVKQVAETDATKNNAAGLCGLNCPRKVLMPELHDDDRREMAHNNV